jgi:hypothetical protein
MEEQASSAHGDVCGAWTVVRGRLHEDQWANPESRPLTDYDFEDELRHSRPANAKIPTELWLPEPELLPDECSGVLVDASV